ncbi:hypothetical protein VTG60DRAFT_6733 [Thermothelomyces hinnuleus]
MGGTRLLPALKPAVGNSDPYRTADIVVLTDGEVWDLDDTPSFVKTSRTASGNRMRFFSPGIGAAMSHALVEGIAKLGRGYAEVIPIANCGGWESRLVAVLEATLEGKIGPIRVELEHGVEEGEVPQALRVQPALSPQLCWSEIQDDAVTSYGLDPQPRVEVPNGANSIEVSIG